MVQTVLPMVHDFPCRLVGEVVVRVVRHTKPIKAMQLVEDRENNPILWRIHRSQFGFVWKLQREILWYLRSAKVYKQREAEDQLQGTSYQRTRYRCTSRSTLDQPQATGRCCKCFDSCRLPKSFLVHILFRLERVLQENICSAS